MPLQQGTSGTAPVGKDIVSKSYLAPLRFKICSDMKPRSGQESVTLKEIEYTLCPPSKLSGQSTSLSGTGVNPATSLAVTIALYSMKESSFKAALLNIKLFLFLKSPYQESVIAERSYIP